MHLQTFTRRFVILVVVVATLSLLLVGSVAADHEFTSVSASLRDPTNGPSWAVIAMPSQVDEKNVLFNVRNDSIHSTRQHELVVIRTDLPVDQLPLRTAGPGVDETQLQIVGRTASLTSGSTAELALKLKKGNYVLICNVGGHYNLGMRTGFQVVKDEE